MHLGEDLAGTHAKALVEALEGEDGFVSMLYLFEAHWKIRDHQRLQHTLHVTQPQQGVLYMVWDFKDISLCLSNTICYSCPLVSDVLCSVHF